MSLFAERGGWPGTLSHLVSGRDLDGAWAGAALAEILNGDATPSQISAFVVALRAKGETSEELSGMLGAALEAATPVRLSPATLDAAIDIVGTGGDQSHSINVSTLAAFVVAACGVPVCKHGNRAATSSCGAADLLEALGADIDAGADVVARCVEEVGFGFCFAPRFHPAFRHAGPSRREIGIPTAFNLLGPMANPSGLRRHLVGVANPLLAERMVSALAARGAVHAWVVHGHGGLDELSLSGPSQVWSYREGVVSSFEVDPSALGFAPAGLEAIVGGDAAVNAEIARSIFAGVRGAARDIVTLNAAAGLVVAGAVPHLDDGVAAAGEALDTGAAGRLMTRYVAESRAQDPGMER